ncbi:hypothetical protein B4135_3537 [Caldibacillus debilis]|uniref:Uncharacterized protein n=1 Tax=Caldibacillus debilis TaxID=301148 RepID=A0A150LF49_9BACI|nr:hypothetical protein B4135_3537 [Caldibacillus debilis]
MRDVLADQEKFIFWDWVIAHRLNEQEVRGSIDKFNERIKGPPMLMNIKMKFVKSTI